VIEDAGFTIYDDIVHGFGGGYWPPVLGTSSRPAGPVPDMRLEANMTVVVQPNVITRDRKAGVQLGELVRITPTGWERLHTAPSGFFADRLTVTGTFVRNCSAETVPERP
jgi:Xaa-Pro dipeptidase